VTRLPALTSWLPRGHTQGKGAFALPDGIAARAHGGRGPCPRLTLKRHLRLTPKVDISSGLGKRQRLRRLGRRGAARGERSGALLRRIGGSAAERRVAQPATASRGVELSTL
jgi:hypothetical protein